MDQPLQTIEAGRLRAVSERQRELVQSKDILNRFWSKDISLWMSDESQRILIRDNLNWVDLPETLEPLLLEISRAANAGLQDGLSDWIFLALGSSSLAARSVIPFVTLPSPRFFSILDSSHPSSIRQLEAKIDLPNCVFILSSKAGDKLEDHALFLYFRKLLNSVTSPDISRHFASVTESNSFLSGISQGYSFRASFLDPQHILSSYCSLHHFGGLLTCLSAIELQPALISIRAMRRLCMSNSQLNPALQLAIFLSSAAVSSCRYLIFLSSPSLESYSNRLGHLIGGSMAKEGCGIVPVTGDVPCVTGGIESNAAFVFLTLAGERDMELRDKMEGFRASGVPHVCIEIGTVGEFLPETFKWEIATVLACASLGLNPFEWPDVRRPRKIAMEFLERLSANRSVLERTPRLQEAGIQLFAEGRTRSEISNLNILESMRSFFHLNEPNGFVALLVFLERTPKVENSMKELREMLTRRLGVPVIVHYGPRCFDQYAYLFRTELPPTLYIVLTADYPVDLSIPGASYTFSQLHQALALGEFESLAQTDRSVIRLNLSGELGESLARLGQILHKALPRPK